MGTTTETVNPRVAMILALEDIFILLREESFLLELLHLFINSYHHDLCMSQIMSTTGVITRTTTVTTMPWFTAHSQRRRRKTPS
jgi:hypothetical protein